MTAKIPAATASSRNVFEGLRTKECGDPHSWKVQSDDTEKPFENSLKCIDYLAAIQKNFACRFLLQFRLE
jgi:hypothetical protein